MKTPRLVLQLCIFLGIAGVALLLTACDEFTDDYISKYCPGSCTVIKGRVTTNNGTVPVAGVTLQLQWNSPYYMDGLYLLNKGLATTDENGLYELRFLMRDNELQNGIYQIVIPEQEKYLSCHPVAYIEAYKLARDTTVIRNYTVAPQAKINFRLTKQEPLQPDETFYATFKYKLSPTDTDSCGFVLDATEPLDANFVAVPANTPIVLRLDKQKAGVHTTEKDVLTLQPGEERFYEVTF